MQSSLGLGVVGMGPRGVVTLKSAAALADPLHTRTSSKELPTCPSGVRCDWERGERADLEVGALAARLVEERPLHAALPARSPLPAPPEVPVAALPVHSVRAALARKLSITKPRLKSPFIQLKWDG